MEGDTIHPAVILYTDQGGAGEDVQVEDDILLDGNAFNKTDGNEGYDYVTAEDLEASNFNWAIINKDVKLIANIKLDTKADASIGLTVPVKAQVNAKVQIKTGLSFKKGISLKKFDTGVYGGIAFKPLDLETWRKLFAAQRQIHKAPDYLSWVYDSVHGGHNSCKHHFQSWSDLQSRWTADRLYRYRILE